MEASVKMKVKGRRTKLPTAASRQLHTRTTSPPCDISGTRELWRRGQPIHAVQATHVRVHSPEQRTRQTTTHTITDTIPSLPHEHVDAAMTAISTRHQPPAALFSSLDQHTAPLPKLDAQPPSQKVAATATKSRFMSQYDPYDVGFASSNSSQWRAEWHKHVLSKAAGSTPQDTDMFETETEAGSKSRQSSRGHVTSKQPHSPSRTHIESPAQSPAGNPTRRRIKAVPNSQPGAALFSAVTLTKKSKDKHVHFARRDASVDEDGDSAAQAQTLVPLSRTAGTPDTQSLNSTSLSGSTSSSAKIQPVRLPRLPSSHSSESLEGVRQARLVAEQVALIDDHDPTPYSSVTLWNSESTSQVLADQKSANDFDRQRAAVLCLGTVSQAQKLPILPREVAEGLHRALQDRVFKVRFYAAVSLVCHYAPAVPKEAQALLLNAIATQKQRVQWIAARCLGSANVADLSVIQVLLENVVNNSDSQVTKEARAMLIKLSAVSDSVVTLITDDLTNDNGVARLMAVQLLPEVSRTVTEDVATKLLFLMWDDWNPDVRDAAFYALGAAGLGHLVHDSMEMRLTSLHERLRCEALKKIGHIGRLTRRLLPAVIGCFEDGYVSVRIHACECVQKLQTLSHPLLDALFGLLESDNSTRAKHAALCALIQHKVRDVRFESQLLWVLKYEQDASIIDKACEAIVACNITNNEDIKQAVLARCSDDDNEAILNTCEQCRLKMGWKPTDSVYDRHLTQIQSALDSMTTRQAVLARIQAEPLDPLGLHELFGPPRQLQSTTPSSST
eukprot:m.259175 g.259175  ORF g.259175 m.259175 type:complete len:787 (+) comp15550_c0_seq6:333-2693(+)